MRSRLNASDIDYNGRPLDNVMDETLDKVYIEGINGMRYSSNPMKVINLTPIVKKATEIAFEVTKPTNLMFYMSMIVTSNCTGILKIKVTGTRQAYTHIYNIARGENTISVNEPLIQIQPQELYKIPIEVEFNPTEIIMGGTITTIEKNHLQSCVFGAHLKNTYPVIPQVPEVWEEYVIPKIAGNVKPISMRVTGTPIVRVQTPINPVGNDIVSPKLGTGVPLENKTQSIGRAFVIHPTKQYWDFSKLSLDVYKTVWHEDNNLEYADYLGRKLLTEKSFVDKPILGKKGLSNIDFTTLKYNTINSVTILGVTTGDYFLYVKDGYVNSFNGTELVSLGVTYTNFLNLSDSAIVTHFTTSGETNLNNLKTILNLSKVNLITYSVNSDSLDIKLNLTPSKSYLVMKAVHTAHTTVLGISNMVIQSEGNVTTSISVGDNATYYRFDGSSWVIDVGPDYLGNTTEELNNLTPAQWLLLNSNYKTFRLMPCLRDETAYLKTIRTTFKV